MILRTVSELLSNNKTLKLSLRAGLERLEPIDLLL